MEAFRGYLANESGGDTHHERAGGDITRNDGAGRENASSPISTPGASTTPPPTRQARRRVGRQGRTVATSRHGMVIRRDDTGPDEHVVLDD